MRFTFGYYDSLTNEITTLLQNLDEKHDWTNAEKELFNSGLVFLEKVQKDRFRN